MGAQAPIRLVLSDIDGTILPFGEKVISERMRAAFHAALDAGVHVGPASGRDISHVLPPFAGDEALTATALVTNGMQVYLDGKLIHEVYLNHDSLVRVAELVAEIPHTGVIIFDDGQPLLLEGRVEDLEESFPIYAKTCIPTDKVPDFDVVKTNVFVAGDVEETARVMHYLAPRVPGVEFNLPAPGFLNLVPPGWSKATGIDLLCERLGISLDEVCVFGDSGNDLEMLSHVPNSAAVANATDEAKAAAHHVIGDCADDAVAEVLERIAAGKPPFID